MTYVFVIWFWLGPGHSHSIRIGPMTRDECHGLLVAHHQAKTAQRSKKNVLVYCDDRSDR